MAAKLTTGMPAITAKAAGSRMARTTNAPIAPADVRPDENWASGALGIRKLLLDMNDRQTEQDSSAAKEQH